MADWFTCAILKRCAPLTYQVKTDSGLIWRRHVSQLRAESPDTSNDESLINVSPIVRDHTTSNDLVTSSAPSVPNQSFADRYPVRQYRPFDRYRISPPPN